MTRAPIPSHITECSIVGNNEREPLFDVSGKGDVVVRLNGYYIVHRDKFERFAASKGYVRDTAPAAPADDWRNDPAADARWCEGNEYALSRLCAVLKVDPDTVDWDGSDNGLQEEADALIWRILHANPDAAPADGGLRAENERLRAVLAKIAAADVWGQSLHHALNDRIKMARDALATEPLTDPQLRDQITGGST